ncbi:hypothetical protein AX17_000340 [Amanita inopinata Kibby_2008]|nr:hypothetical protein AX17_000340 [Amanita inopinata Kibby_2008]
MQNSRKLSIEDSLVDDPSQARIVAVAPGTRVKTIDTVNGPSASVHMRGVVDLNLPPIPNGFVKVICKQHRLFGYCGVVDRRSGLSFDSGRGIQLVKVLFTTANGDLAAERIDTRWLEPVTDGSVVEKVKFKSEKPELVLLSKD